MALLLLLTTGAVTSTEVYRWTDDAGRVHFGDRPPAGGAERLQVAPPPAANPVASERAARTQRLLDAFADERTERREQRAAAAAATAERARQCAAARENHTRFAHAGRVVRRDEAGNRVVLEGEAYESLRRELEQAVIRWCGTS